MNTKPNRVTLRAVNRELFELCGEGVRVELVQGKGYHYYTFDDGKHWDTTSVMVPYLQDQSKERWVEDGLQWALEVQAKINEWKEYGVE